MKSLPDSDILIIEIQRKIGDEIMAQIIAKSSDRVLISYLEELEKLIYGEQATALGALLRSNTGLSQEMENLTREFATTFCGGDPDPSLQKIEEVLEDIQLDGRPFPFFEDSGRQDEERKNKDALMAYAMLKIRDGVLYQNYGDPAKGHVVWKREGGPVALKRGPRAQDQELREVAPPVMPQEMGRWKTFANKVFGFYEQDWLDYETKRLQYEERRRAYEQRVLEQDARTQYKDRAREVSRTQINFEELRKDMAEAQKKLEEGDPAFHINSRRYKDFISALRKVNQLWDQMETPQNRQQMLKTYDELNRAGEAYLRERSGSHATKLGAFRAEQIRGVMGLQKRERQILAIDQGAEPRTTLGKRVESARRLQLQAGDEPLAAVGAATSLRLKVGPENGLKGREGFFTADKRKVSSIEGIILPVKGGKIPGLSQSAREKLERRIGGMELFERLMANQTGEEFLAFFQANDMVLENDKEQWEQLAHQLGQAVTLAETNRPGGVLQAQDIWSVIQRQDGLNPSVKEVLERSFQHFLYAREMIVLVSQDPDLCCSNINRLVSHLDYEDDFDSDEAWEVTEYFQEVAKEVFSFVVAGNAQIPPDRRSYLNERNIATSVMAELLGCRDVVVSSESACLKRANGKKITGMFMEFAQGIDGETLVGGMEEQEITALMENGVLKRQAADLQALDCICGQIDRHMNNVMFQVDPRTGGIVGLKGIDNDMSFGLSDTTAKGGHSTPMGLIRVVSRDMAEALEALNQQVVDYRLRNLLSEDERKALWQRIDVFREWVKSGQVEIVENKDWASKKWMDLAEGYRGGEGRDYQNIFYRIGESLAPEEEKLKIREARKLGSTRRQREEAVAYRGQVREMVKQGTDFADQRNAQLQNASQRRAPRGEKKTVQQKPPVRSK